MMSLTERIASIRMWLRGHYLHVTPARAVTSTVFGVALAAAALFFIASIAGLGTVVQLIRTVDWSWLGIGAAAVVVSHAAYGFAYREVMGARELHPISHRMSYASVVAGFGLLVPRSGFAFDRHLWVEQGFPAATVNERVVALGVLEYALLAPGAFIAAVVLLVEGYQATQDVLPSWVIGVPAGTVIALSLLFARRRLPRPKILDGLHRGLEAVTATLQLIGSRRGAWAVAGMALYWAADITALGACLFAVGKGHLPVAALIVAYATGYALTRRGLPLAGAGAVELLMPLAMHWLGTTLAVAVVAVLLYRVGNLWLPLLPGVMALRHLRRQVPIPMPRPDPARLP